MATKKVDAVFEGGGVKGLGLVGAAAVVEERGYAWNNLAGTSAGAIVAALLAAGYTGLEMKKIMTSVDYRKFEDATFLFKIPLLGPLLAVIIRRGIFAGDYFERWIGQLLAARGIRTFRDLVMPGETDPRYRYKLNVITSDLTHGLMVVLPQGAAAYGINPDDFPVAAAVRMSMSIPFFFRPAIFKKTCFVDGGILSNFPIWLFDSPAAPEWPTFGFKLVSPEDGQPMNTSTPISMITAMFWTMMSAHDKEDMAEEDFVRTIKIPTIGVHTTDFNLPPDRRDALLQSGETSAREFFKTWDFDAYVRRFRMKRNPFYVEKVVRQKKRSIAPATAGGVNSPAAPAPQMPVTPAASPSGLSSR